MRKDHKNPLRLSLIGLSLLATLGVVFYPTDEKRVKAAAEALIAATNGDAAALSLALETHATPDVSITLAELPEPLTGRSALVAAVGQARQLGQPPQLHVDAVEVFVDGKQARLNADLIASSRPEVPELRRPRHAVALFEKRGDRFLLVSAEIGPERRDQPEARP